MTLIQLVHLIRDINPGLDEVEVAQLAHILLLQNPDRERATEEEILSVQLQLTQLEDQLSAVAQDLEMLAATEPTEFSPSHVWTLIRAIKAQSQMLSFYQMSECPAAS